MDATMQTQPILLLTATCPPRPDDRPAPSTIPAAALACAVEHNGIRHYGWNRCTGGRWVHRRISWRGPGMYREARAGNWWPATLDDDGAMWFAAPGDILSVCEIKHQLDKAA